MNNGAPGTEQQDPKEVLDGLSQLWANLQNPNSAPSPTMQPGYPGGPPLSPDRPLSPARATQPPLAAPVTSLPPNIAAPPPQPAAVAAPATDDPQLAGARQRFQDTTGKFNSLLEQQRTLGNQIAAVPQTNRADYKPSVGRNILAMVLGTMAGMKGDTRLAADTADSVRDLKYNRAEEARNKELAPFLAQQNSVERQVPLLNAENESAWREYSSALGEKKENLAEKREQDTADWHNTANDIRKEIGDATQENREARISQQHQNELDKMATQSDNLDLRKQALQLQQQLNDIKQQTANTGQTGESDRATQAEITQKQRPINSQLQALEHTRALLLAEGDKEGAARLDAEISPLHDKLDKIENDVRGRRQPAGGAGSSSNSAPAPAGAPPAALWRGKESKTLTLKDSKGNTSKWQLVGGVPQEVKAGASATVTDKTEKIKLPQGDKK